MKMYKVKMKDEWCYNIHLNIVAPDKEKMYKVIKNNFSQYELIEIQDSVEIDWFIGA